MDEYSDKSDIVRLMAKDLREEHGEDEEPSLLPTAIGIILGFGLWWFVLFIW